MMGGEKLGSGQFDEGRQRLGSGQLANRKGERLGSGQWDDWRERLGSVSSMMGKGRVLGVDSGIMEIWGGLGVSVGGLTRCQQLSPYSLRGEVRELIVELMEVG